MEKNNVIAEDRTPGFTKSAEPDMYDEAKAAFDAPAVDNKAGDGCKCAECKCGKHKE